MSLCLRVCWVHALIAWFDDQEKKMNEIAKRIPDTIKVLAYKWLGPRHLCLIAPCSDYDEYRSLPDVVEFQGIALAKTGWNSDKLYANYDSKASWARKA